MGTGRGAPGSADGAPGAMAALTNPIWLGC